MKWAANRWTPEDDRFLVKNYEKKGLEYCCRFLDRSVSAVFHRVSRLGITIPKPINSYQEIASFIWVTLKKNAKVRNLDVSITLEDIWNKFISQDRKCALSGLDIKFGNTRKDNTASVDRIDSKKGYINGNIQIVYKDINRLKMDFPEKTLFNLCKNIYFFRKKDFNWQKIVWELDPWLDTDFPLLVDSDDPPITHDFSPETLFEN